jgi:hypothetical protein
MIVDAALDATMRLAFNSRKLRQLRQLQPLRQLQLLHAPRTCILGRDFVASTTIGTPLVHGGMTASVL